MAAKARLYLAPTVCSRAKGSVLLFVVREFLKGVWGKLLPKKFPPQNTHIYFLQTLQKSFNSAQGFQNVLGGIAIGSADKALAALAKGGSGNNGDLFGIE